MKDLFLEVELKMKDAVDHFHEDLKHLRTGRASLTILDGVTVDYYGTPTPMNQVAKLSIPEPTLIVAQPYDPSLIPVIEKAILQANIGLNPGSDGKVVRLGMQLLPKQSNPRPAHIPTPQTHRNRSQKSNNYQNRPRRRLPI